MVLAHVLTSLVLRKVIFAEPFAAATVDQKQYGQNNQDQKQKDRIPFAIAHRVSNWFFFSQNLPFL
jgi:hypothetical protein